MSINTVTTGSTVLAADVNQLVNILQRASGQTEAGKYYIESGAYQSGWYCGQYMPSLTRVSTPVSISIDTADQAPAASAGTPATIQLTANGFVVQYSATALSNTSRAGGNYTTQF